MILHLKQGKLYSRSLKRYYFIPTMVIILMQFCKYIYLYVKIKTIFSMHVCDEYFSPVLYISVCDLYIH